jgi:hypothetical protein
MKIFILEHLQSRTFIADRITDHMRRLYGENKVIRMTEGNDANKVSSCNVVLVIIGPDWNNLLDSQGQPLINNPSDPLRRILAEALHQDKMVVPLLVGEASMPTNLPGDLSLLLRHQGVHIRADPYFRQDMLKVYEQTNSQLNWHPASLDMMLTFPAMIFFLVLAGIFLTEVQVNNAFVAIFTSLFILCLFLVIGRSIYLSIKRQGWIWLGVLIITMLVMVIESLVLNNLILNALTITLWLGSLLGFALFGPRREKVPSVL